MNEKDAAISEAIGTKAFHSPDECAKLLGHGHSRAIIFRLLASGQLRSFKIGRSRLISSRALADYIASRDEATAPYSAAR